MFTQKYREITNAWLVEAFNRLVPDGLVSHFRGDGDTITGNILIPDIIRTESDSDYGGGIGFRHSEVGIFRIQVLPFVFRAICCNGCVWGALEGTALRKVHLGDDVNEADLFERIKNTVHRQIPLVPELIARIQRLGARPPSYQCRPRPDHSSGGLGPHQPHGYPCHLTRPHGLCLLGSAWQ